MCYTYEMANTEQDQVIVERYRAGESAIAIAKSIGVVKRTVYNALERAGIKPRRQMNSATPAQEKDIIKRYVAGESPDVLAAEVGINRMTVYNILERNGVDRRLDMNRLDEAQRRAVAEACRGGMTYEQAAERFNIGTTTVNIILREFDVSLPIGRPPIHEVNDRAFDKITPEAAYWMGFLFTDGHITTPVGSGEPRLIVGLGEKDRAHLEKLKAFLSATNPIRASKPKTLKNGKQRRCVYLSVRSQRICSRLRDHGFQKKELRSPSMRLVESKDFWRGCVDGDGSIGAYGGYPRINLCGHTPMLEKFRDWLATQGFSTFNLNRTTSGIFIIVTSGEQAIKMIDLLYSNAVVFLDRKMERVKVIMNSINGRCNDFPTYDEEDEDKIDPAEAEALEEDF